MKDSRMAQTERELVAGHRDMPDENFVKHYNKRHLSDMPNQRGEVRYSALDTYYGALRRFHDRCHRLGPDEYDHDHDE